ncbi:MAG: hypothetical protein ACOC2L_03625 [Candidatus Sumerlaeota bacterium]
MVLNQRTTPSVSSVFFRPIGKVSYLEEKDKIASRRGLVYDVTDMAAEFRHQSDRINARFIAGEKRLTL